MMTASDKIRFSKIMNGMADNFRDSITKDGMAMRFKMLKNFNIEQIESAALEIMKRRKYTKMPTIADFIEALNPVELAIEDKAIVEANKILSHLQRYGAGVHPEIDDPITKDLMNSRWPYYRWASTVLESELKWWVKEFSDAYRAHSGQNHIQIENKDMRLIAGRMLKSI